MRPLTLIAIFATIILSNATPALAGGKPPVWVDGGGAHVIERSKRSHQGSTPAAQKRRKAPANLINSSVERNFAAKERAYKKALDSYNLCTGVVDAKSCGNAPDASLLNLPTGAAYPQAALAALPAQDIAYMAFARLKLTPPKPIIGPPPTVNPWKMAAVGYPLWLSVSGNPHPAAVVDTVGPLRVSLDAHISRVVFDMGDGHKVTCQAVTTAWSRSVKPGQSSPDCGYTYQRPSLPRGPYTVAATTYWSVAWTVTHDRGVIDYAQTATAAVPVGELQVLVR